MYKIIAASILGLGITLSAHAQPPRHADPASMIDRISERLIRKLDMSEAQTAEVRGIVDGARPGLRSLSDQIRKNHQTLHKLDPAVSEFSARVDAIAQEQGRLTAELIRQREQIRAAIHATLTPEQRDQMQQMMKRQQGSGHHRRRGGHS